MVVTKQLRLVRCPTTGTVQLTNRMQPFGNRIFG